MPFRVAHADVESQFRNGMPGIRQQPKLQFVAMASVNQYGASIAVNVISLKSYNSASFTSRPFWI